MKTWSWKDFGEGFWGRFIYSYLLLSLLFHANLLNYFSYIWRCIFWNADVQVPFFLFTFDLIMINNLQLWKLSSFIFFWNFQWSEIFHLLRKLLESLITVTINMAQLISMFSLFTLSLCFVISSKFPCLHFSLG